MSSKTEIKCGYQIYTIRFKLNYTWSGVWSPWDI